MGRAVEDDEEAEELADVEVERMPNLDGWEFFKAIDAASESERWTLALQHDAGRRMLEYAFWTNVKEDPAATGILEVDRDSDKRWARAVRQAVKSSEDRSLDNDARAEVVLAILREHDPTLETYEERLLFTLDPPDGDEDDDDDDDGNDDD
jgi:hypothetical protein